MFEKQVIYERKQASFTCQRACKISSMFQNVMHTWELQILNFTRIENHRPFHTSLSVFVWKQTFFSLVWPFVNLWKRSLKTHLLKTLLEVEIFKNVVLLYSRGRIKKRLRHGVGSSLVRARDKRKLTRRKDAFRLFHCFKITDTCGWGLNTEDPLILRKPQTYLSGLLSW